MIDIVEFMRCRIQMAYSTELERHREFFSSFLLFEAYSKVIGSISPSMTIKESIVGFIGFLSVEVHQTSGEIKQTVEGLISLFSDFGIIIDDDCLLFAESNQDICDVVYLNQVPTSKALECSGCWFLDTIDEKKLVLNLTKIRKLYSGRSEAFLVSKIRDYVSGLGHREAEVDTAFIVTIAEGLREYRVSTELEELHLTLMESENLLEQLFQASNNQMKNAGFDDSDCEKNWIMISKVVTGFFIPVRIFSKLCLNSRYLARN